MALEEKKSVKRTTYENEASGCNISYTLYENEGISVSAVVKKDGGRIMTASLSGGTLSVILTDTGKIEEAKVLFPVLADDMLKIINPQE